MAKISVVVPVFNEEQNIALLYQEISKVLKPITESFELWLVDDGSSDGSAREMRRLHAKDKRVKAIFFRRNYGQTAAMHAGFAHANGEIIVSLDADLQNDPADIPNLLTKLEQGYDCVCGWRWKRRDGLGKKLASRIADIMRKIIIKDSIHDSGCSLKAYRKDAVKNLQLYGEMHRYIPAIIELNGFKVAEVKVNHRPRRYGKTKYGITRIAKGLLDLIYIKFWGTYSTRPLHFFGVMGIITIITGFLLAFFNLFYYYVILKRTVLSVGPLLLLSVLLVILGVQFIVLGFIGEILVRTYYAKADEKPYNIKEIL